MAALPALRLQLPNTRLPGPLRPAKSFTVLSSTTQEEPSGSWAPPYSSCLPTRMIPAELRLVSLMMPRSRSNLKPPTNPTKVDCSHLHGSLPGQTVFESLQQEYYPLHCRTVPPTQAASVRRLNICDGSSSTTSVTARAAIPVGIT
jgi:hypothetical protein